METKSEIDARLNASRKQRDTRLLVSYKPVAPCIFAVVRRDLREILSAEIECELQERLRGDGKGGRGETLKEDGDLDFWREVIFNANTIH